MPSLTINNMPDSLYLDLQELAQRDKRSLREEILLHLSEAVATAKARKPAGAETTRSLRRRVELLASDTKTAARDAPPSLKSGKN